MKHTTAHRISLVFRVVLLFRVFLFGCAGLSLIPLSLGQEEEEQSSLVQLSAENAGKVKVESLRSDKAWRAKVKEFTSSFGPGVQFSTLYTFLRKKSFVMKEPPGELLKADLLIPHEKTVVIPGAEKKLYFGRLNKDPAPWNPFSGALFEKDDPERTAEVVIEDVSEEEVTVTVHFDRNFKIEALDFGKGDVLYLTLPKPPEFTGRALFADQAVIVDSSNIPFYHEAVGNVKRVVTAAGGDEEAREKLVQLNRELGEPIPGRAREKAVQVSIRYNGFILDEHVKPVDPDVPMPLVAPGLRLDVCRGFTVRFPGVEDALYATRSRTLAELYSGLVVVQNPKAPTKGIVIGQFSVNPEEAGEDPGAVKFTFAKNHTLGTVDFQKGESLVFFKFQETAVYLGRR